MTDRVTGFGSFLKQKPVCHAASALHWRTLNVLTRKNQLSHRGNNMKTAIFNDTEIQRWFTRIFSKINCWNSYIFYPSWPSIFKTNFYLEFAPDVASWRCTFNLRRYSSKNRYLGAQISKNTIIYNERKRLIISLLVTFYFRIPWSYCAIQNVTYAISAEEDMRIQGTTKKSIVQERTDYDSHARQETIYWEFITIIWNNKMWDEKLANLLQLLLVLIKYASWFVEHHVYLLFI